MAPRSNDWGALFIHCPNRVSTEYPGIFVSGEEYSVNVSKWVKHVHQSMDVTQWCARAKASSSRRMWCLSPGGRPRFRTFSPFAPRVYKTTRFHVWCLPSAWAPRLAREIGVANVRTQHPPHEDRQQAHSRAGGCYVDAHPWRKPHRRCR